MVNTNKETTMTEFQQFKAMLERAQIGHGLRHDYNPPGESVLVEAGDEREFTITEFGFNEDGKLVEVVCYPGEPG